MPASAKPMKAMNSPMPPATAANSEHGADDQLPHARDGQDQECQARQEHAAERRLPRQTHALDHRVSKVGIQAHAGSERQRVVRQQSHEDAAEARRQTGRDRNRSDRHAGRTQDDGIDDHDVRHRHEGRQAREQFGADRRTVGVELEEALEHP
jgi:hypothetical protein